MNSAKSPSLSSFMLWRKLKLGQFIFYLPADPADEAQPAHALHQGSYVESCRTCSLPTFPGLAPPALHLIVFTLVKQNSMWLYVCMEWLNTCQMNALFVWLGLCSFCFHLSGPPFIYLSILCWGIPSSWKPSLSSTSLLWVWSPWLYVLIIALATLYGDYLLVCPWLDCELF